MPLSEAEVRCVLDLVRAESGVDLDAAEKAYLVEARLEPLARAAGLSGLGELVARLREPAAAALRQQVVEAMLTGETSFFRDVGPFEVIRRHVLPELIARRREERRLRIWCGAVSTGQEAYSLALLLREHFPELADWDVQLIGTDLAAGRLDYARRALYSQLEVGRGLPAQHLVKHFVRQGRAWQVAPEVARMATFRQINLLATPWPLPPLDLVLLRNVLIYFAEEARRAVLAAVRGVLRRDGYLFLGSSETTLNLDDAYEWVVFDAGCCYRIREGARERAGPVPRG